MFFDRDIDQLILEVRRRERPRIEAELSLRRAMFLVEHPDAAARPLMIRSLSAALAPDEPDVYQARSAPEALSVTVEARDLWFACLRSASVSDAFDTADRLRDRFRHIELTIVCPEDEQAPLERLVWWRDHTTVVSESVAVSEIAVLIQGAALRRRNLGAAKLRAAEARAITERFGAATARRRGYAPPPDDELALAPLDDVERARVKRALVRSGGDRSMAAAELGISRGGVYRRMQRYDIDVPPSRGPNARKKPNGARRE